MRQAWPDAAVDRASEHDPGRATRLIESPMTVEEETRKLRLVVEVAREVWGGA